MVELESVNLTRVEPSLCTVVRFPTHRTNPSTRPADWLDVPAAFRNQLGTSTDINLELIALQTSIQIDV
jgi:hypothetical protein